MIPLYGFLEGDVIGLLILADEKETIQSLRERLKTSAAVRVAPRSDGELMVNNQSIPLSMRVEETDLRPLDRFDVVWSRTCVIRILESCRTSGLAK